ncbi:hypothetical protein SAMN04488042_1044 [Shimia aestuarii]|uniref:Uncharacterized protein n=1 Tax=Shimia aestuarii TaxID=254406 RepID=A0A1I4N5R7_9RHOB|nr:hypothetical protein SAMN04488042_1044 [Shimia aestuarii]
MDSGGLETAKKDRENNGSNQHSGGGNTPSSSDDKDTKAMRRLNLASQVRDGALSLNAAGNQHTVVANSNKQTDPDTKAMRRLNS